MKRWMATLLLLLTHIMYTHAIESERTFRVYTSSSGMIDNSAQVLECTKTGRIMIVTLGHVNFYNGVSFSHVDPPRNGAYPLPKYTGFSHAYFDRQHHLWLKNRHEVTCVNLIKEKFVGDVRALLQSYGVEDKVDDLFIDENGWLWVLVGNHLVNAERKISIKVRNLPLQDFCVNDGGIVLFYADGTTDVYEPSGKAMRYSLRSLSVEEAKDYGQTSVLCLAAGGIFQIRTGKKGSVLMFFDMEKRHWRTVMKTPYSMNSMKVNDHRLYVACVEGYWIYDLVTEEMVHHREVALDNGKSMVPDVNAITFDMQGGMWLGTKRRGLLYSKPYSSPFRLYDSNTSFFKQHAPLFAKAVEHNRRHVNSTDNCAYVDSRGWTWYGTFHGLQLKKNGSHQKTELGYKDGLANEVVRCIVEDNNHNMWVGTSYGVARVDIKNNQVRHIEYYSGIDNVPDEAFVEGGALKLADGSIVMQTVDHMVVFNPDSFHTLAISKMRLYPKLCKILMNGQEVHAGVAFDGNVVTDRAVTRTRDMSFNYDQNSITLMFAGLNYFRPLQTYYRVRVKGFDAYNDWRVFSAYNARGLVDKVGALHLPLAGIRPGYYEIELQASMSPDHWEVEPYVWRIYVKEPWWRTTVIYVILGIVLCVLLALNLLWFSRLTKLRMEWRNDEQQVLKRLKNFVQRCCECEKEIIAPVSNRGGEDTLADVENHEFERIMVDIMPQLLTHGVDHYSLSRLADMAGVEKVALCNVMMANFHRSPKHLMLVMRLKQAARLLCESRMGVKEIAAKCGFATTNYLISSFFHYYRCTPQNYCASHSAKPVNSHDRPPMGR